ncbi:MAG: hypothetical protein V1694_06105 [Candidatus Eisenbacteria bacterium]
MAMTHVKQMQEIANRFIESNGGRAASAHEIAKWAIDKGFWKPHPSSALNQCATEISEALRQEYILDPQGRTVRAKHAARILCDGEQQVLWADIRSADRPHMEIAFKQRRKQVAADCCQLKRDVDSYNENNNPGEPIQIPFDFTPDVLEAEAGAKVGV